MSANFNIAIAADAAALIGIDGEFAEAISFTPKLGTARTVYAIIDRDPPESIGGDGRAQRVKATLLVQNHVTTGVLISEMVEGATVTFAYRKGDSGTSEARPVRLARDGNNVDAGMIRLEV